MVDLDALLARGRELLRDARRTGSNWGGLPPLLSEGAAADRRELDRRELAWALQYDHQPASERDLAIARRLLGDEVAWRSRSPEQGIGETMELTSWLLSRSGDPADVWLLAAAKRANFDTGCGLDLELLFCAGVAATIAYVEASARPERAAVLALLVSPDGAPRVSDQELASWQSAKSESFPSSPSEEDLTQWIERALACGYHQHARALVQRWAQGREPDAEFLAERASYLERLGDLAAAADARAALVAQLPGSLERAAALAHAASTERRAKRWARAQGHLEHAALLHRNHRGWRELGLGRELVREAFTLADEAPPQIAARAFALADEFAVQTPRLPPAALTSAIAAARKLGEVERADHYQRASSIAAR